jgi:hypothetical protein
VGRLGHRTGQNDDADDRDRQGLEVLPQSDVAGLTNVARYEAFSEPTRSAQKPKGDACV